EKYKNSLLTFKNRNSSPARRNERMRGSDTRQNSPENRPTTLKCPVLRSMTRTFGAATLGGDEQGVHTRVGRRARADDSSAGGIGVATGGEELSDAGWR